ncbi:DMBT1 protein, partial [Eudromia elegans]|nr:DMBT1 protein [Eudromia elegans]
RCAGRVEVKHRRQWGTVCNAAVVCRQLGCGSAVRIPQNGYFGRGSGPIWLNLVRCKGTEAALSECAHNGWGKRYCSRAWDAGVVCSGKESSRSSPLGLVNGSTSCSGRVEIEVEGTWGTLCHSGWDIPDAHVLCHQLNCG